MLTLGLDVPWIVTLKGLYNGRQLYNPYRVGVGLATVTQGALRDPSALTPWSQYGQGTSRWESEPILIAAMRDREKQMGEAVLD